MVFFSQIVLFFTLAFGGPLLATEDPYFILGIDRSATLEEGQSRYRMLVKRYHPDLNRGDVRKVEKFKEIASAWAQVKKELRRSNVRKSKEDGHENKFSSFDLAQEHERLLDEILRAKSRPEVWAYMEDELLSSLEELQERYEKSKSHSTCEDFFID